MPSKASVSYPQRTASIPLDATGVGFCQTKNMQAQKQVGFVPQQPLEGDLAYFCPAKRSRPLGRPFGVFVMTEMNMNDEMNYECKNL